MIEMDCRSHSCKYAKERSGQRVNTGCRCHKNENFPFLADREIGFLRGELDQLKAEIERLETELGTTKIENELLKLDNKGQSEEIERLEKENGELKAENERLETELGMIKIENKLVTRDSIGQSAEIERLKQIPSEILVAIRQQPIKYIYMTVIEEIFAEYEEKSSAENN